MSVEFRSITRARTEAEKRRRHIHGDHGATFSKGKFLIMGGVRVQGCVTTFPSKDCLCAVIHETS